MMARRKKVWGMFAFDEGRRYWKLGVPHLWDHKPTRSEILEDVGMEMLRSDHCWWELLSGTVRPDGSIAWPKKWPVP